MSGAARSLAEVITHLDAGWEPHVLTPAGAVVALFESAGAKVFTAPASLFQHTWDSRYAGRRLLLLAREAWALPPHVLALDRLLGAHRYALVHLNDSPLLAAAAVAKRRRLPVIWHLRSALSGRGRIVPSFVRRTIARLGDAAVAIDDDVARSFALELPTTTIFNSVSLPDPLPDRDGARRRLGIADEKVSIGFIGNLRRIKGWPELVKAAALMRHEPARFVIVGGGVRPREFFDTAYGRTVAALGLAADDESEMRRAVVSQGLEDLFTFVPFTDDVGDVYPALDVVAFPNQGVGLGRPILEAAAFGLPAVAGGSRDGGGVLLPNRTGVLLESPSPEAIADALTKLVRNPRLRSQLGEAARAHARQAFDAARNTLKLQEIYARVARSDPGRR